MLKGDQKTQAVLFIHTVSIDDSVKGGLTQFWELFTVIQCAPKDNLSADIKRLYESVSL